MPTRIIAETPPRLSADLIKRFAAVPVAVVVDLLEGRTQVDPAIRPLRRIAGGPSLLGSAVTASCDPKDYGAVHHAIAVAEAGDVVVIDAGGRSDVAMIGDLLSTAARRKGIVGLVADGAVRDTGILGGWSDFAVFTRHVTARGPASKDGGTVDAPVTIGGAPVRPRDLILGDDDGVVVIPREAAEDLIAKAEERAQAEIGWEKRLSAGETTLAVFGVPDAVRG
ncbi:RraA family protein [Methylobacterium sp. 17Sr1-1]|uniref:RraA family protein n=1 Tax=Methylobacterium sp. 17Sr1-1 TaxID=2202826 RepID=UPI000D700646|nr:RraA family protein [Methylobacterium sp. 17Sr1-1]AWN52704.1 dimethylmenaquinone methyltransferase [Methylobacterium sp. 17Sr1-1]